MPPKFKKTIDNRTEKSCISELLFFSKEVMFSELRSTALLVHITLLYYILWQKLTAVKNSLFHKPRSSSPASFQHALSLQKYGTFSLLSPRMSVFPLDRPPLEAPHGLLGDGHWIRWTSGWGCTPGFGINEMILRSLTNPGATFHCPKEWKDRQPGSRPTAVGLCRLRLAHTFAVLTVSYLCWGWSKWKKSLCGPHTGVPGTIHKQLWLRRELVPCPCCYAVGSTASWNDSGQDLTASPLRPEPGEQLRAAVAHITLLLPRWEHSKTQSSEAGDRRTPREKASHCPGTQHGQNSNYCETSQWLIWHYSQRCFWI